MSTPIKGESGETRSRLSADVYRADWEDGAPAGFARAAAAAARRRVRLRRARIVAQGVAVVALLGWFGWSQSGTPVERTTIADIRDVGVVGAASRDARRIPAALDPSRAHPFLLSDDEALELLRGRPLMVFAQADGTRRIVLLDGEREGDGG